MKKVLGLPTRAEVLKRFFSQWSAPIKTEFVYTANAFGKTLAADAYAQCDRPVVRASSMDGVGVRSAEFACSLVELNNKASNWKLGVDYCRADTGDDFPDEFDAVVPIEDVDLLPGGLRFHDDMERITAGHNVIKQGEQLRKGAVIVRKGTKLTACDLGALCIGAVDKAEVYKNPVVAFIPTGNELVPLGTLPERGQGVDSNSLMVRLMMLEMGAEPLIFPITRDDKAALTAAFDEAFAKADVVVLGAGSSKGEEDYCHTLLSSRGTIIAHGVAAAPGKPLSLAIVDGKPCVNTAGPPLACFNGFDWCVRAIVNAYLGHAPIFGESDSLPPQITRRTISAVLAEPIDVGQDERFEAIVRIDLERAAAGYIAHPVSHRTRHHTNALIADGLYTAKIPPEPTAKGDKIEIQILR
ncbi:MAG: molybdopterin molybdotransferase MoeA [Oscillospiraceae bacterium]|jgi:molybdopterin molybdotransferase/putative molybdopterin biosynthesis protein|nr:molybdopterin molybdotransferase MoeA [Oscillospiraceae bacterium]